MKFYECKHYGLVYQRDSGWQYDACKKEHDGRDYADCKREKCKYLNEENNKITRIVLE